MSLSVWVIALLLVVGLLLVPQLRAVLGRSRGVWVGLAFVGFLVAVWGVLGRSASNLPPSNWAAVASVSSESCQKCHAEHYDSWHRSFHRTMTREATPEYVKGDFANASHDYQGLTSRFTREGDSFFMETIDPNWAAGLARGEASSAQAPKTAKFKIDRLVGSHWLQECLHKEQNGRYMRLPVLYHIGEQRWIHTNGAFLAPDTPDFWSKCRNATWNDTCLYCHNTGPVQNAKLKPNGEVAGFDTTVAELGISCEACHGPGSEHVRRNQNPARRYALEDSKAGDPSIVNPLRLTVERRDEICARCHGALMPKPGSWDVKSGKDPFIAGLELGKFNHRFRSEAERLAIRRGQQIDAAEPIPPTPTDGRFWGDGTPLTTGLEYNGMVLSACYQKGKGKLSCLSCHEMHTSDPNHLVKPGLRSNEACLQCHNDYRTKVAEHSRHGADSAGSQCMNCHMPHQVYSLMTTHRSHRIENPSLEGSVGTGKPHACNLCHLDKSLGWTRDQLQNWPGLAKRKPVPLSADEENISAAILMLSRDDGRTRALVSGAFSNPAAQQASGTDWFAPFLTRLMDQDRFPAVRYLSHRGLKSVHGEVGPFDFLGKAPDRSIQLKAMRDRFDRPIRPNPFLPLTANGLPDEAILERLRQKRTDPDLTINE